jgi:YD repeat-containing protein
LFARSSTGVWTYKSDDGTSENYDDNGRITMRSTKPGQTLHYRYFDGKLVQVVSQSGRVLTLTNISKSGQQSQHFDRDANGNVLTSSDGEGNTTSYEYDHLNRKVAIIDSQGNKTTLIYNNQNKVIRITDARGNSTTYTYNAFGEKIYQNNPDSGEKTDLYNQAGQLLSTTDANGNDFTSTYDLLGRLLTKSANDDMIQSFKASKLQIR